ncbi:MAG: Na+/H+ antiporter NhaC family protein [Firmicutes bacterium]|nr:Na+/H+ antiporter NhaC family protein [Bacillota bacterium]
MNSSKNRLLFIAWLAVMLVLALPILVFADEEAEELPALYATWWSVLPPLVAIILALITKEVYSSLFLGVLVGGILYAGADLAGILNHVLIDGMVGSLSDSWNVGILFFLVFLGILVAMMNLSGGSSAFGRWAKDKIKTRAGAQRSTIFLGILIFVDDYFNCLTVGSVMRPLTDEYNISRAKLAYLIDSTAAPICIIAPISSWAAAVSGFVEGENGLTVFLRAIPYNFYALLTIVMMFALVAMKFDYGKMATFERNAQEKGDLFTVHNSSMIGADSAEDVSNPNGRVIDLVLPIIVLIISCLIGMIYTGGFFEGTGFVDSFAGSDASVGLVLGSAVALVLTIIFYVARRTLSFNKCMDCVPEGFKAMVSPIAVLTLAWTLNSMTSSLGLSTFVETLVNDHFKNLMVLLPALIFLVAVVLAIASGTSWGTFGMLIPIAIAATSKNPELMYIAISACMAGAVCGDHCSPISDTTIMSSAGAGCNHLSHVESQFPYAMTVAGVSFVGYIIAGITKSALISLPIGIGLMLLTLFVIRSLTGGSNRMREAVRSED